MIQRSAEVFVADDDVVALGPEVVADLKTRAASTPRRRCRVCAHADPSDALHEMLIVLDGSTYVRPHKHLGKSESFHVVEGTADIVTFDDDGEISQVIELGDYASGRRFYYRLNVPRFHTVLVRSDAFVVHETTNGPFVAEDVVNAPWAPEDEDVAGRAEYLRALDGRIGRHLEAVGG